VAGGEELGEEGAADEAGGAGYEDVHGGWVKRGGEGGDGELVVGWRGGSGRGCMCCWYLRF
jgi:hypothetical protein